MSKEVIKKESCPTCGQNVSKRKVTMNKILVSAAAKFCHAAIEQKTNVIKLRNVLLTNSEYARVNDLVRFGLLYKNADMFNGEYGVPIERIQKFIAGEHFVAEYFLTNPLAPNDPVEMSANYVSVNEIKGITELMEELGPKVTEYILNPQAQKLYV